MTNEEKAGLLAERLMGWHKGPPMRVLAADVWVQDEDRVPWRDEQDHLTGYVVDGYAEDVWHPFEDISQAKLVQAAMFNRRWYWVGQGCMSVTAITFLHADPYGIGEAFADTEAEAICEAAGRALGLW